VAGRRRSRLIELLRLFLRQAGTSATGQHLCTLTTYLFLRVVIHFNKLVRQNRNEHSDEERVAQCADRELEGPDTARSSRKRDEDDRSEDWVERFTGRET